jgi:methylthioribulose 1-phosphate dehydratase/enolase-phosphatase E1
MQIQKQYDSSNNITKNTLSSTSKLQYLDSSKERATVSILAQLGVTTSSNNKSNIKNVVSLNGDLCAEHNSEHPVTYEAVTGTLDIDIRDEADCWIRASLHTGDVMTVPATMYRRLVCSPGNEVSIKGIVIQKGCNGNKHNMYRHSNPSDRIAVNLHHNYRELVCELCRQFFTAGWVTGTGGSISIRYGNRIYMTPSGVQKERIEPDELYVLDTEGAILCVPEQKPGRRLPKLSDCSPLFLHAFKQRKAGRLLKLLIMKVYLTYLDMIITLTSNCFAFTGAVLHSHSICCNMATSLFEGKSEFRISHQEMIKGIKGYGYFDELAIPIIENTAHEHELADSLGECIANNPKACAVLVRRHGMYVWGDTWEEAKRHGECLHYLFEVAISMKRLSMDFNSPPHPLIENGEEMQSRKRNGCSDSSVIAKKHQALGDFQYVLFDIEGTTTPISFVKDVLFPYAAENFATFLEKTWTDKQTIADVQEIKRQASIDLAENLHGVPQIIKFERARGLLIGSIVEYLKWNMSQDRKIAALKDLQGHVWAEGYASGKLNSIVYDDVARFFVQSEQKGFKIGIYSSGSRDAQRLLFKHSNHGDLRKYLSCYFDTSVGQKRSSNSYIDILKTLGVDHASRVVFVTDILEEAAAAAEAGMQTIIAVRPGNSPLPENHGFKLSSNFDDIL